MKDRVRLTDSSYFDDALLQVYYWLTRGGSTLAAADTRIWLINVDNRIWPVGRSPWEEEEDDDDEEEEDEGEELPATHINVARHDGIQLVRLFAQLLAQRLDVCNRMQCVITHIIILLNDDSIIVVV